MGKRPDGCERLEAEERGEKKENMQASEEIPRQGRGHGAEPESHSFPGRGPSDLTFVPSTVDSDPAASLFAVPQGVVAGILATAGLRAVRPQRRGRPDIRVTFSPQESGWGNSQAQGSALSLEKSSWGRAYFYVSRAVQDVHPEEKAHI